MDAMNTVYEPGRLLWTTTPRSLVQSLLENPLTASLVIICIVMAVLLLKRKRTKTSKDNLKAIPDGSRSTLVNERTDKIGRFFNEERIAHMNSSINEFLTTKRPFLQHKYSLGELADDVDIPLHYLSAFINRYHKTSFTHFINKYRVAESKQIIKSGEWRSRTLEAIASEAGFNNRNTFTTAFKKETGVTPFEYLQAIKKSTEPEIRMNILPSVA